MCIPNFSLISGQTLELTRNSNNITNIFVYVTLHKASNHNTKYFFICDIINRSHVHAFCSEASIRSLTTCRQLAS